ncbi:spore coat associated protein CotJA [Alicyclobacillus fodiniaquatilis]|uniref:Spore coat associated protein CotJA n=1 Tax=Alicyclobacillus fodiniaquatilis TaxID=1661150 RepID=A0ABW4JNI7_9BACL
MPNTSQWREYRPYHSPFDPCSPRLKRYVVAPNLFIEFQAEGLKQFSPHEALRRGTLWPDLYSPYPHGEREART